MSNVRIAVDGFELGCGRLESTPMVKRAELPGMLEMSFEFEEGPELLELGAAMCLPDGWRPEVPDCYRPHASPEVVLDTYLVYRWLLARAQAALSVGLR